MPARSRWPIPSSSAPRAGRSEAGDVLGLAEVARVRALAALREGRAEAAAASRPRPPARPPRPTASPCCRRMRGARGAGLAGAGRPARRGPADRGGGGVHGAGGDAASSRCSRNSGTATPEDDGVDRAVDTHHQRRQHQLRRPGQPAGVEHRQHVVAHEIALIGRLARSPPQLLLQRRERADPSGELDSHAPQRGGQMDPPHPRPAQHQEPAESDEGHEEEVEDDEQVGEESGHAETERGKAKEERRRGHATFSRAPLPLCLFTLPRVSAVQLATACSSLILRRHLRRDLRRRLGVATELLPVGAPAVGDRV